MSQEFAFLFFFFLKLMVVNLVGHDPIYRDSYVFRNYKTSD